MTTRPHVALIVEGHGEVAALPIPIRRVAEERLGIADVEVSAPFRIPRGKFRTDEVSRAARFLSARVGESGGVLILLDADSDCAVELSRDVAQHAGLQATRVEVVAAVREYEAWFLAGIESLRGHSAVRDDAVYQQDPEAAAGAKERLSQLMNVPYRETLHQPAFSALLDIDSSQSGSRSFRRLVSATTTLLA